MPQFFFAKETLVQVFSYEIFKNNFFWEHLQATASDVQKWPFVMLKPKVMVVVAKQDLC